MMNPYQYFSILGDSISTLRTYSPDGYRVFYIEENCEKSGVYEIRDTWWGKVIEHFGGMLLVNNSYSGSRVTKLPFWYSLFPSGCSEKRTSSLHLADQNPDVIMIYLGFNDWANFVDIDGRHQKSKEKVNGNMSVFSEAYRAMLTQIKENYPKAEVWCITLNQSKCLNQPKFFFSDWERYRGKIDGYNEVIRLVAKECQCKVVDIYQYEKPYDSIDGAHPNAEGMKTIAELVIKEIEKGGFIK